MGDKRSKVGGNVHWNDNLVCSIDVETTGLDPNKHELIDIAIVPLDFDYDVSTHYPIFNMYVAPRKPIEDIDPDAMGINQIDLSYVITNSVPSATAVELFIHWFENLQLPKGKKILPLGCNYAFDRSFLIDWMGNEHYRYYFSHDIRDIKPIANWFNDKDSLMDQRPHFPKVSLRYISNILAVENPSPHKAIGDAVATQRCYRKMLTLV